MKTRGGTESDRPSIPEPADLCAEHGFLALAVISLTTMVVGLIVEEWTSVIVFRGMYSALAGLFVAGIVGWIVGNAERRVRRDLGGAVTELTAALTDLRDQVERQRTIYLPDPGRQAGRTYASAASSDSAAAQRRAAVDPDELREQVEQVVAEELGTRASVRSQGYAEGYVDGVSRRGDAEPSAD